MSKEGSSVSRHFERNMTWLLHIRLNLVVILHDNKPLYSRLMEQYDKENNRDSVRDLIQVDSIMNSPLRLQFFLDKEDLDFHTAVKRWNNSLDERLAIFQNAQYQRLLLSNRIRSGKALSARRRLLQKTLSKGGEDPSGLLSLGLAADSTLTPGRSNQSLKRLMISVLESSRHLKEQEGKTLLLFRIWELALIKLDLPDRCEVLKAMPVETIVDKTPLNPIETDLMEKLICRTFFGDETGTETLELASHWVSQLTSKSPLMAPLMALAGQLSTEEETVFLDLQKLLDSGSDQEIQTYNEELSMRLDTEIYLIDGEDLETKCDWRQVAAHRTDRLKKTADAATPIVDAAAQPSGPAPVVSPGTAQVKSKEKGKSHGPQGLGFQGGNVAAGVECDVSGLRTSGARGKRRR
eukprot:Protomagalhaensia_sp_Gyna_25__2790@NODE_260_length_4141_cov_87_032911_g201_i0_p2_GENE_NODE_260_length_4141_cov_87_032911_g201_i0NODE_260_length_4141_cov_87_032911_g201_i0_p2_ORF_typecomplete_len408_score101_24_NODE_260_length_4141_cov_87_032911_g201_i021533376